ncbi:UNVERIFIED_CONTAM: hypothetical protein Scaly_1909400 [Sesamum calycinum]|uniref:Reverse transcriptase n=1 Tax=Sesamum calycinum TaxID=2727403 RepID=A0AAW2NH09_9LAMI
MEESDLLTNLIDKTTHLEFSDDEALIDQIPNLTTHFPIVAKVLCDKPLNHNAIKPTLSKAWNIPPKTTINAITQNTLVFSLKTRKIAGASGDKTHGHSEPGLRQGECYGNFFNLTNLISSSSVKSKLQTLISSLSLLQSFNLTLVESVPALNRAGGLCLAWTPCLNVYVVLKNSWIINALISLNAEPRPWQFMGVHCPAVSALRPVFWHSFNNICYSFDGPWLAMGDFNVVMSQTEKRGGKPFASASRNALGNEFDVCNLIDLGFTGASFTWSNKRLGNPILRLHNLQKLLRGELRKWNRRTFGWSFLDLQDAVKCMEIIQLGACFPVSKQSTINIWEQPWIPSIQNFTPECPQDPNLSWSTLVRDLIDQSCNQWKLELLNQMFPQSIVKEIRKIQILESPEPPRPFWAPSKLGKFSTKAVFHTIQRITTQEDPNAKVLGKRIWSLDLHNRLKLFVWRTLFDTLPTRARNDLVHGSEAQNPEQVAQSVLKNTPSYSEARISKKAKPQTNCEWQPPPVNWIKVNSNIALKDDKCFAALIARDHQSFLIWAETTEIFAYDASLAKLRAICLAAEKIHDKNEERVIFESDSTEAIK